MKKLFAFMLLGCILQSCNYRKDEQIISNFDGNSYYMVRVWSPQGLTNSGALQIWKLPMEGINDKKVDSVNKLADDYIKHCEKYAN